MLSAVEGTSFEHLPVEEGRAQIAAESRLFGGTPIDIETVRDLEIPAGDHAIPARLYRPAGVSTPAPLLVYFHGGGFVLGSLESGDSVCRFLARHGDAVRDLAFEVDDADLCFHLAVERGARIVRVHDVRETVQALCVLQHMQAQVSPETLSGR